MAASYLFGDRTWKQQPNFRGNLFEGGHQWRSIHIHATEVGIRIRWFVNLMLTG